MNNFENKLKHETNHHTLSSQEKATMRALVFNYRKPITIPVKSPLQWWMMPQFVMPVALVLLLTVVGTGTTYAAQTSLPGDILYPLKINVVENIKVALAVGPKAKAQVHTELAAQRLDEAQELASEGRLDATTTAEIQSNFNEHALAAQAATDEDIAISATATSSAATDVSSTTSPVVVATIISKKNTDNTEETAGLSALIKKAAVLATIGDDSADTDTKNNAKSLSMYVQSVVSVDTHTDQPNSTTTKEMSSNEIAVRNRHWGSAMRQASSTQSASSGSTSSDEIKNVNDSIEHILTSLKATTSASTSQELIIHSSKQETNNEASDTMNGTSNKKTTGTGAPDPTAPSVPPASVKSLLHS
jgi:hypothetical protein